MAYVPGAMISVVPAAALNAASLIWLSFETVTVAPVGGDNGSQNPAHSGVTVITSNKVDKQVLNTSIGRKPEWSYFGKMTFFVKASHLEQFLTKIVQFAIQFHATPGNW